MEEVNTNKKKEILNIIHDYVTPVILLVFGLSVILYYIIGPSRGYMTADSFDSLRWGYETYKSGKLISSDFYYAAIQPFGGNLFFLPFIATTVMAAVKTQATTNKTRSMGITDFLSFPVSCFMAICSFGAEYSPCLYPLSASVNLEIKRDAVPTRALYSLLMDSRIRDEREAERSLLIILGDSGASLNILVAISTEVFPSKGNRPVSI